MEVSNLFEIHRPRTKDILPLLQNQEAIYQFITNTLPHLGVWEGIRKLIHSFPRVAEALLVFVLFAWEARELPEHYHWLLTLPNRYIQAFNALAPLLSEGEGDEGRKESQGVNEGWNETKRRMTIGIIPDGNRRWAKARGLSSTQGHFFGSARIIEIIKSAYLCPDIGHLVVYILSYDNFQKRSPQEQDHLLAILREWTDELCSLENQGYIRYTIAGEPSPKIQEILRRIPNQTLGGIEGDKEKEKEVDVMGGECLKVTLLVCYDGRREIQAAKGDPSQLWVQDEFDAVIRTGGTCRASGFCPYQTTYANWYFDSKMWPEITPADFYGVVMKIRQGISLQNHGR